jgi:hypothetical protein
MLAYTGTTTLSDEVVEMTGQDDGQLTVTYNAELFGLPESEAEEDEGDEEEGAISTAASLLTIGASLMVYLQ